MSKIIAASPAALALQRRHHSVECERSRLLGPTARTVSQPRLVERALCVVPCVNRLATHVVTGGAPPPPLSPPVPCLLLHRRRAMLQFDKHTALICATENNLFETNRQNVTVQMQNHNSNLLVRSILQPLQGSAFGKMSWHY